jgi:hypothetical protein
LKNLALRYIFFIFFTFSLRLRISAKITLAAFAWAYHVIVRATRLDLELLALAQLPTCAKVGHLGPALLGEDDVVGFDVQVQHGGLQAVHCLQRGRKVTTKYKLR